MNGASPEKMQELDDAYLAMVEEQRKMKAMKEDPIEKSIVNTNIR